MIALHERWKLIGRRLACQESVVRITAGRCVQVECCRRILEYNDIRITLQLSDMQLHIWGSKLRADSCAPDVLTIYGEIQSIEWIRTGGK